MATACTVGDLSGPNPGPGQDPGGGPSVGPDAAPGSDPGDPAPNAPDAAPPDYALAMAPATAAIELGQEAAFTVTLDSDRFAGPVALTASGVPDSWLVTFTPSDTIELPANGTAMVTVTVAAPSNAEPAAATLGVIATAAPGERGAQAALEVANQYTVTIADGVGEGQHEFPGLAEVRLGTNITILNADATQHRIHSNNDEAGFPTRRAAWPGAKATASP